MPVTYSINRLTRVVIHFIYKSVCVLGLVQDSHKSWHLEWTWNSNKKHIGLACLFVTPVVLLQTYLKMRVQFPAVMGNMGIEMLWKLLEGTGYFMLLPHSGVFCSLWHRTVIPVDHLTFMRRTYLCGASLFLSVGQTYLCTFFCHTAFYPSPVLFSTSAFPTFMFLPSLEHPNHHHP